MRRVDFGRTGLKVSRLSIGTDYRDVYGDPEVGGQLLKRAFELGVNFWDTADNYGAHPGIREALRGLDRLQVVVATKTYGSRRVDVEESLERSMMEMGIEWVDVYLLHAIDRVQQLKECSEALKAMVEAKESGLIRAIGLSTHTVPVMKAVLDMPEIEVVLTVINKAGSMIREGSLQEMLEATQEAYDAGKAIYLMKVLARGELTHDIESALRYVFQLPYIHSASIGMTSIKELEMNVNIANKIMSSS